MSVKNEIPGEVVTAIVVAALATPVILVVLLAFSILLGGCAAFQDPELSSWNKPTPAWPCGPNDPRLRPDGVCCAQWEPRWNGPDQTGHYYCEPKYYDPDDPNHDMDPP